MDSGLNRGLDYGLKIGHARFTLAHAQYRSLPRALALNAEAGVCSLCV